MSHPSDARLLSLYNLYRLFYGLNASYEEWVRAKWWHEHVRSPRSRLMDEMKLARLARSYEEWRRAPNRTDLPGVDTPEIGLWRLHDPFEPEPGAERYLDLAREARKAVELYLGAPLLPERVRLGVKRERGSWLGYYAPLSRAVYLNEEWMEKLGEEDKLHVLIHELVHVWSIDPEKLKAGEQPNTYHPNVNEPATETAAVRVMTLGGKPPKFLFYRRHVEELGRLKGGGDLTGKALQLLGAARRGEDVAWADPLTRQFIPVDTATRVEDMPRELLDPEPSEGERAYKRSLAAFLDRLLGLKRKAKRGGRGRRGRGRR